VASPRDVRNLEVGYKCLEHRGTYFSDDRAALGVSGDQQRRTGDAAQGGLPINARRVVLVKDAEDVRAKPLFRLGPGFQIGV
jgi:hypothetical protein